MVIIIYKGVYTMKKGFNIAANVCTIILMGIIAIGALFLISNPTIFGKDNMLGAISVVLFLFCTATIVIASITIAKGNRGKAFGLKLTVTILVGIIALIELIGGAVVYGILSLIPVGLEIASMCIPEKKQPVPEEAATPPSEQQSVEKKIEELKRLKEFHVLSDEQYEQAISEIVNDLKK